jgi:superfamily II DNA/RNA helicase
MQAAVSPGEDQNMLFSDFALSEGIVSGLAARGITTPSPIQAESLPFSLEGRDILGRARTGTGKTLAFALPIVTRVQPSRERGRLPRVIVLSPTRELAKQIAKEFNLLGGLEVVEVYGGSSYMPQQRALSRGVDVVVGTPGRVNDLLERRDLDLTAVEVVVLDEADEMLSMGFQEQVETILATTPAEKQTMLFSATMPRWVERLATKYQSNPKKIDLVGNDDSVQNTTVQHVAVRISPNHRTKVLADLLTVVAPERAIIFTRTKRDCDELALALIGRGLAAEAIHGDLAQAQRERALESFRSGNARVLVATDVAARGLDIPDIELVVQHHFPQDAEAYVHRSGRTGRAGRSGMAVVLYTNREERDLRRLEHDTGAHFSRQEPPKPNEVQAAASKNAGMDVRHVSENVIAPFRAEAKALLEEFGEDALARALAYIAGVTTPPKPASLITGEEGFTTLRLNGQRLGIPKAVAILAGALNISARALGKIREVRGGGVVADVPTELVQRLLDAGLEDVDVSIAQELPDILEERAPRDDNRRPGGYGSQGGKRYGDFKRGSYGNRDRNSNDARGNEGRGSYARDDRGGSDSRRASGPREGGYRSRR